MKKILLLLVFFPTIIFSQTNFKNLDSLQFRKAIDQIILDTGKNYKQVTDRQDYDENNLKFVNVDDENDILILEYGSGMDGENKDLEIKGTKKWSISTIYGKYLRIFPIWKKYADPSADAEKLSKKGFMILNKYSINRINDQGIWRLIL